VGGQTVTHFGGVFATEVHFAAWHDRLNAWSPTPESCPLASHVSKHLLSTCNRPPSPAGRFGEEVGSEDPQLEKQVKAIPLCAFSFRSQMCIP